MAAEVSSLRRILNGGGDIITDQSGKQTAMITRDFLGLDSNLLDFKELDLDLDMHVPSGWEKRLDLMSGKVYIEKQGSMISTSTKSKQKKVNDAAVNKLQDLNYLPATKPTQPCNNPSSGDVETNNPLNLNLILFMSSSASPAPVPPSSTTFNNNSVCTLDKVKSALERAERETRSIKRTSSSSPSRSSSSIVDNCTDLIEEEEEEEKMSSTFASGCPNCLIYVLVSRNNPKCPRCCTIVPSPNAVFKKPRIDLNISL